MLARQREAIDSHWRNLKWRPLVIRSNPLRQMIKMVERERQLWESRAEIHLKKEVARAGCLATVDTAGGQSTRLTG